MKKIFLIAVSLLSFPAFAIDESQLGSWYGYDYQNRFDNSKFGIQGDWQYRNWDVLENDRQTTLFRNSIFFQVNDQLRIAGGYVHLTRGPFGENDRVDIEHRPFQEVLYRHGVSSFRLQHRVRSEQRWRENDFITRYRYSISFQKDLVDNVYLSGYNEYFIDGKGKFDQNRTKLALGFRLNESHRIHFGYMHQIDNNFDKGQIMFTWYHNYD